MIIYHRADNDGKLSGAIAVAATSSSNGHSRIRNEEAIGWDFSDDPIDVSKEERVIVVDLPLNCIKGIDRANGKIDDTLASRLIWIDHHASSIANSNWERIRGLRIDGVAACRLAWQYFYGDPTCIKSDYVQHAVAEHRVIQLVGEYDVWDKRNPDAELFNFGTYDWDFETFVHLTNCLLDADDEPTSLREILLRGKIIKEHQEHFAGSVLAQRGYMVNFDGIKFVVLNSAHARSSMWFPEAVIAEHFPEAEALCAIRMNGTRKTGVSLYHRKGHEHLDLSAIAVTYGGGGHKGACGFEIDATTSDVLWILPG